MIVPDVPLSVLSDTSLERVSPRRPAEWALFLDVDGTLLDLAPAPDRVLVPAGLVALLEDLARGLGGALALVSGRAVGDVLGIFAPLRVPVAGLHGLELARGDGLVESLEVDPAALEGAREPLRTFVARHPGALLEDKRLALALHTRQAPEAFEEARALVHALARTSPRLTVQEGKAVVELRPAGGGKDVAIERFLAAAPFRGRWPVFAGDDRTDEDGFAAVNRHAGLSILVGPRRPTRATAHVETPTAFRTWLAEVHRHLRDGTPTPNT